MKEIEELLSQISDERTRKIVLRIFVDIKDELSTKPAAIRYHHAYASGLYDHVKEVMNITLQLFDTFEKQMDCSRDDAIVASFCHDFNKIDQYVPAPEWKKLKYGQLFDKKESIWINEAAKTVKLCAEYGLILNDTVMNAVCLHHGSWSTEVDSKYGHVRTEDFTSLAILLHSADLISSQVLGRKKNEG